MDFSKSEQICIILRIFRASTLMSDIFTVSAINSQFKHILLRYIDYKIYYGLFLSSLIDLASTQIKCLSPFCLLSKINVSFLQSISIDIIFHPLINAECNIHLLMYCILRPSSHGLIRIELEFEELE